MNSWERLFDNLSEGIFLADDRLRFVYMNGAARRLLRRSPMEPLHRSVATGLREAGFVLNEEELFRLVEKPSRKALNFQRETQQGSTVGQALLSVLPGSSPPVVLGVIREAGRNGARKGAQETHGLCEALTEAAPDGIFVVEPQTRIIIYANEAFHRNRRLRPPLGIGQACYRLLAGRDRPCGDKDRPCPIPDLMAGQREGYCALKTNGAPGDRPVRLSRLVMEGGRLLVAGMEPHLASSEICQGGVAETGTARSPSYQDFHRMVANARKTRSLQDLVVRISQDLERLCGGSHLKLLLLDPSGRLVTPFRRSGGEDAAQLDRVVKALISWKDLPRLGRELERTRKAGKTLALSDRVAEDVQCLVAPFQVAAMGCVGSAGNPGCYYILLKEEKAALFEDFAYMADAFFQQLSDHLRALVLEETVPGSKSIQDMDVSHPDGIIGRSKCMAKIYELIDLVAASDATVLITGENGTGKELVAQAIHNRSHRKKGPFVVAHCNAYSPTLLESELFGHEKGAFTGAIRRKMGRIERAQGGTLFLDEIGDIAPATQVLLLRFLQDHRFERVGGETTLQADVRVLAATNRNLLEDVEAGRFRDDLYYRLNVISIHLPPLRERKEDIPLLSHYFLKRYNAKEGKKMSGFSSAALQALMDYDWPGNVRQLENAVSHAVILAQDAVVRRQHLPRFLQDINDATPAISLAENEKRLLLKVLRQTRWNKHQAARQLQVSRSTLYSKIQRYGLRPDPAV
ncbi:PAS domain-containing protein [Desulfacinum hydrothermale DSM 13146]|uniref:PAS domain-containing protein n=1 Tax=Desulfacinum hydrothermale DSM 13146 TaxID=1121390 RepID=A0A1W1XU11_9BACT|nr:sigma 54-interacting transcriptional regulator [Desulfacinum hydrothermale]SMC27021.1 PAS domain-containing protein [Desulfacinum hydrothermale DSM 13146]